MYRLLRYMRCITSDRRPAPLAVPLQPFLSPPSSARATQLMLHLGRRVRAACLDPLSIWRRQRARETRRILRRIRRNRWLKRRRCGGRTGRSCTCRTRRHHWSVCETGVNLMESRCAPKQILVESALACCVSLGCRAAAAFVESVRRGDLVAAFNALRGKHANAGGLTVHVHSVFATVVVHFGIDAEQGAAAYGAGNDDFECVCAKAAHHAPEKWGRE